MAQIGSDENPMMFRKSIVSKDSRFRKNFDKKAYDFNYDRIFKKASNTRKEIKEYNTELEACRLKSKTFSMEQD